MPQEETRRGKANPKRDGPVDLAAIGLGQKKVLGAEKHITTTVRVDTAAGAKELRAMLDTGATLNFISQLSVKELKLTAGDAIAPSIHSICGHTVRTYQTHSLELQVQDSEGQKALI